MFPLAIPLPLWYHVHMKKDQINLMPLFGFFVVVCFVCVVTLLVQTISALFAV